MHIAEIAIRIRTEIQNGTLPFSLVLPSLFSQEWTDNVLRVQGELQQQLDKHRKQSGILSSLHQLLHGSPLSIPDVTAYLFTEGLHEVCTSIMASANVIEAQDQCALKAVQRVIEACAPAQKGKQSYKDCQIFEETLLLGQELRSKGFTRKIVFASSNKIDYGRAVDLLPAIRTDLDVNDINFADSLTHAYHVAAP